METNDLPSRFENCDVETQRSIIRYLSGLNEIQTKAYLIAKDHLGSSFNVVKSNGYINWLKNCDK